MGPINWESQWTSQNSMGDFPANHGYQRVDSNPLNPMKSHWIPLKSHWDPLNSNGFIPAPAGCCPSCNAKAVMMDHKSGATRILCEPQRGRGVVKKDLEMENHGTCPHSIPSKSPSITIMNHGFVDIYSRDTIWLFNIAMGNHHAINRETIYFYGPSIPWLC
jgi:hypothetical protein